MSRFKNRYKTARCPEPQSFDGKGGMYITLKDPLAAKTKSSCVFGNLRMRATLTENNWQVNYDARQMFCRKRSGDLGFSENAVKLYLLHAWTRP